MFDTVVTYFEMKFENGGYKAKMDQQTSHKDDAMPIKASIMFEMFPFCILYNVMINKMTRSGLKTEWKSNNAIIKY